MTEEFMNRMDRVFDELNSRDDIDKINILKDNNDLVEIRLDNDSVSIYINETLTDEYYEQTKEMASERWCSEFSDFGNGLLMTMFSYFEIDSEPV